MQNDIQQKLKLCLELTSPSERDVVYVLVGIGKLIELTDSSNSYPTLLFFRNWVVHSRIDRKSQYGSELSERFKLLHIAPETVGEVFGFVDFIEIENEIIRFSHQQIEKNFLPDRTFLKSFKRALMQVIADVPVLLKWENAEIVLSFDKQSQLHIDGPGEYKGTIDVRAFF